MTKREYAAIEAHMLEQMCDSAHDRRHVYRVLNAALDIARHVDDAVDMDVLLAACLLHDIGRERQFADPGLDHAEIGGEMAREFLLSLGWPAAKAAHVRDCIASHRYRGDNAPQTLEAKILFDADKLDATGALGIVRTLIYCGQVGKPIYVLDENGNIAAHSEDGGKDTPSFIQEYNYKLKNVYESFYTVRAKEIAEMRRQTAVDFYGGLFAEVAENIRGGIANAVFEDE